MYPWPSIGENVGRLRWLADLTQEDLAAKAGVSVDLIRSLEQGRRSTAQISSLYRIAGALDVPLAALFGHQNVLQPEAEDREGAGSIHALREVLTPADGGTAEEEPASVSDLTRLTSEAWRLYWTGAFSRLVGMLPGLITAAELAAREASDQDRAAAYFVLAEAYNVASAVTQIGYLDLGYIAARKAVSAAEQSGDPRTEAAATRALSWVLMHQGRLDAAERTALDKASSIEPSFGTTDPTLVAAWGRLLWMATASAVRNDRLERAADLLGTMRVAADRLGHDINDGQAVFGPTAVSILATELAVERGEYGEALGLAQQVPPSDNVPMLMRTHYMLEVATAQCHARPMADALATLLEVRQLAPEWMRYQVLAREAVRMLTSKRGASRRTDGLRELAVSLNVGV